MGEGTWHWICSTLRAVTFKEANDTWLIANCPYPPGTFLGSDVVTGLEVKRTDDGWYWDLQVRELRDDDLEAFWDALAPKLPPPPDHLVCGECGATEGVRLVQAMTVYPDTPILFCGSCAEDYRSYWQERWDEYYSGLL
jgi:hypothetical protein